MLDIGSHTGSVLWMTLRRKNNLSNVISVGLLKLGKSEVLNSRSSSQKLKFRDGR